LGARRLFFSGGASEYAAEKDALSAFTRSSGRVEEVDAAEERSALEAEEVVTEAEEAGVAF
jgi:hypothetical protein